MQNKRAFDLVGFHISANFFKVLEIISHLLVKHEIVSPAGSFKEGGILITGTQHSFLQVSSYINQQQTTTRGNLLKRKYGEHPLSVQSHGLRSDATGEHPLHPL